MIIAATAVRASFVMGVLGLMAVAVSAFAQAPTDDDLPPQSDYDCIEGDGNGPGYTGEVLIVGDDQYDLDDDGDGVGCDGQEGLSAPATTTTTPVAPTATTAGPLATAGALPVPDVSRETLLGLRVSLEWFRDGYVRPEAAYDRQELLDVSLSEHTCYLSVADDVCHSSASEVQVDHIVALAEAWDSRPAGWTQSDLEAFSIDARNLWLMTAGLNGVKADQDAAEWLPPNPAAVCGYVKTYVAVKAKHDLAVDANERHALGVQFDRCAAGASSQTSGTGGGADSGAYSGNVNDGSEASGATEPVGGLPFTGPGLAPMAFIFGAVLLVGGAAYYVITRWRDGDGDEDSPEPDLDAYPQLWEKPEDPVERYMRRYDEDR